ncbi:MAG: T9SS type A sorting domain-containing protein [Saprospiraceae bacterium]
MVFNYRFGWGTYTIQVVDANGCEDTIVKTVTSSGSGLAFTYIKTYSGCSMANGTVTLTIIPGTAPYQIFVDGNLVATTSNLIYTIQGLSQGNHIVRVKDALGCSAQETIEIIQAGSLNVNASGMAASCSNPGSIMLDISGGAGPFDIYIDGVFHTTTNDRWYTIYNLNAGTYTIRVVDVNGCEGTVTETVPGGGQNLHVSSSSTPCGCGLGTGTITIDIDNGTAPYELYLNDTLIASIQDDHYVFGGLFPGTYEIKVIDANGCQKVIQETVGSGPGVNLQATVHGSGCTPGNGVVNLDIANGVAPFEIYVDGNLVVTTPDRWYDLTNLAPGTYTIKVIDAHGCEDVEVITVPGSSPITLTGTTTACSCTGNTGTITVSIAGGMGPFDVFLDGNYIATTPNRQYTIAGLAAGTYDVKVVDKNGCEGTLVKTVQAVSNLAIVTQSTACGCGQANGTITVNISGGPAPYDVYLDGQLIATTPNTQYIIGGLNPGTYDIRIEDANGCSATARETVASHNNVQLSATSTPANCGINDGTITVNIFGGSPNYDIFLDNQLIVNTQDTVYVIDSLPSGTYLVRVVDVNGCEASKYVTVDESNNLEVESTNTACGCVHANGSITLNILGGMAPYDIVMDNTLIGITFNQTFTVAGLAIGTYDFEITDKNGCTGFLTDTVTLGQTVYFSSHVTDASCGAPGSISIVIQDGVGPYMLFLDGNMVTTTNDTTYTFDNLAPGNYSVRVKDSLGCEFSKLLTVGGSLDLDIQVDAVNDTCGNGGSATIHIFDGTVPYEIFLDGQSIATTSDTTFEIFNLSMGTYSIRVEDSVGCFDMETITIDSFGVIPHAFFTYMIRPGGVVKFFADSVVGTILWDFGDGDTSTLMNPVHYYTIDSTYVVCLTATTICGTDTYCDTITIPNVYNSNLVFKMEDVEGRKGETVQVPIKVGNFDRVIDLQYSISVSNPDAVEIVGVSGIQLQGLTATVVSGQTITLDWTDPSGDGVSLPDEFPIAEIDILLKGDRGDCSQVLFGNMPVQTEVSQKWFADPTRVMPVFIDADAVCINMMVSIKGNVHREDHKGIPDASVLCNNANVQMSQVNTGDFEFDDIMYGSNCMLVPSKDGEDRVSLNVIDIVQMNKHVRQSRPLNSPYKIIAGDLNRDGRVSYQDKVNLIDLVKGDAQRIVSGESWRFLPANWQFTDPSNPFNPAFPVMILNVNVQNDVDAMDFVGVKLGDVDNSYSFDGNQAIPTFRTLRFETDDQAFNSGDEVVLEMRSSDFQNISGFQTEWNFDQTVLEFKEIQAASIVGMGAHNLGTASIHDGIVTLVWHDEENLPFGVTKQSDEVLFSLVFTAKKDGNTLNGRVWQNNLVIGSLAVNAEGGALDVSWDLKNLTAIDELSDDRLSVKAYPNPFSTQTQINVEMKESGDALLTVYDQTGRLVWKEQRDVLAGNQVFNLEGKLFKSGGIYYYKVQNGSRTESGKLIYIP